MTEPEGRHVFGQRPILFPRRRRGSERLDDAKSVVIILTDITDLKNVEILKRDFFLNASHELKSPLTSIIGSADLIANGFVTDPDETVDLAKESFRKPRG
jgi:signal transduction histidine kinase